eukprot:12183040-Ditylum_brightwellii.AAC.1
MSRHGLILQVGNLPSNRLALTNKIYLSPNNLSTLLSSAGPEHGNSTLVLVGPHPYAAEAHPQVPDDQVAMNGLHRRFAQLSLSTKLE